MKNTAKDTVVNNTIKFSYSMSRIDLNITSLKQDFIHSMRDYKYSKLTNVDGIIKACNFFHTVLGDKKNNGILVLALTVDM